ncbi:MAG: hypothetical protein KGL39_13700 [Patescibacteria group bacterium]|nr:hypothetical protein [Patescibacteria group bacterium]
MDLRKGRLRVASGVLCARCGNPLQAAVVYVSGDHEWKAPVEPTGGEVKPAAERCFYMRQWKRLALWRASGQVLRRGEALSSSCSQYGCGKLEHMQAMPTPVHRRNA